MKKLLKVISALLLVIVFAAGCSSASSSGGAGGGSDYPKKTIKMIVPWDAGGDTDVIMRLIADQLGKELGQNVVVTNIPGGGGSIGAKEGLGAKGDGYTIIAGHDSIAMSELTGITDFSYFDFKPVSLVTSTHDIIATSSKSKWDSMEDVLKDAKENPGKIKFGATLGSTSHLTPASIQYVGDVEFNIVGYEGTAKRTQALIGQHVDLGSVSIPAGKDYLKAGELKLLGIAAEERDPSLPDLPTLKEQGIDFVEATNRGIFVPKETPDEIVDAIDKALGEVAKDEEFQKKMADMGTSVNYKNSEEYTKFLEENYENMKKTLEANGLLKK